MPLLLGIDVGSTSVKAVVIRAFYKRQEIAGAAIVDLAPGVTEADAIKTAAAAALGPKSPTPDAVATSIIGEKTSIRSLTLPKSVEKQLEQVLPFELDSNLAFDVSQAVFDYRVMPPNPESPQTMEVLIAVARIDDVRTRIELVKGALNAEPERVGVGPFPLATFTGALAPQGAGPVAILDLGKASSELIILENGDARFARSLSLGTQGLPGTAQKLARELRVTLAAYRAQGGKNTTKLYLAGGGAFVTGAQAFLSSELEIEVAVLPPPPLDVSQLSPETLAQLPRLAKAVGLALSLTGKNAGFDLRRGVLAYERGFSWLREKTPVLLGIAVVLLVSFVFSGWAQLYAKGREKAALAQALGTVTKDVLGEETEDPARANELLATMTGSNDEDPLPHADAFDILVRLSEDVPQSMTHDIEELDFQKNHVVVHGIVGSVADAQSIATSIKGEHCMSDVKIARTNQVVGGTGQKYVLEFDEKCPEDDKKVKKKTDASASSSSSSSPSSTGGK